MRLIVIDGTLETRTRYVYLVTDGNKCKTLTDRQDAERCAKANARPDRNITVYAMKADYYWSVIRDTRGEIGGGYWDFPTFRSSCHCKMILA